MHILIIEPGKHPREEDIEHTLENLHKIVGGYIQAIYPYDDPVALLGQTVEGYEICDRPLPGNGSPRESICTENRIMQKAHAANCERTDTKSAVLLQGLPYCTNIKKV